MARISNKGQRSRALIPVPGAHVAYPAPDPIREPEPRRTPPRPGQSVPDGQWFAHVARLIGPMQDYEVESQHPGAFKQPA